MFAVNRYHAWRTIGVALELDRVPRPPSRAMQLEISNRQRLTSHYFVEKSVFRVLGPNSNREQARS